MRRPANATHQHSAGAQVANLPLDLSISEVEHGELAQRAQRREVARDGRLRELEHLELAHRHQVFDIARDLLAPTGTDVQNQIEVQRGLWG